MEDGVLEHSSRRKLWMQIALALAVIGLGVTIYSTMHHMDVKASGQTDAACNINDTFSCDEVALSQYSEIWNVPLGVWGFGYFLALASLILVGWKGGKHAAEHLHGYAAMVAIGVVTSFGLAALSHFSVGAFCLTCIGVYNLTIVQAMVLVIFRKEIPSNMSMQSVFAGGTTGAIAVAAAAALFIFASPGPSHEAPPNQSNKADIPAFSTAVANIPIAKTAYAGLGEDYRKGNDNARVVIQEFADFECPACARMASTISALGREYGDQVLIVFRNYPLDQACNSGINRKLHEFACKAAVMARCAGQYGKFWQYHDLAFGQQRDMKSNEKLKEWGRMIGLTPAQVDTCWDSPDIIAKVKDDVRVGGAAGVDSTPTIFINGRKYLGNRGLGEIRTHIDELLAN